jgi:hypothetical protein
MSAERVELEYVETEAGDVFAYAECDAYTADVLRVTDEEGNEVALTEPEKTRVETLCRQRHDEARAQGEPWSGDVNDWRGDWR